MNPIDLDLSDPGHLVDPPILDFLAYDADLKAFVIEFVPDPALSQERKESVFLPQATTSARRVTELLAEVTRALRSSAKIVRIAHAGAGDFDFYTESGQHLSLRTSPSPQLKLEIYNILQVISLEAQIQFVQARTGGRAAG